ncbi:MAG: CpsD/CapB family tyrosine-protein kinase [Rubrobacteraceae bacterium]
MARGQLRKQSRKDSSGANLTGRLIVISDPSSSASEAYRTLRTNLMYALIDTPPRVMLVTSPGPTEGKSTTCANLGVTLAQAEKRTLIVDCDLRKPTLHKVFGLRNFQGVVNVMAGEQSLREAQQEVLPNNLKVLTVGTIPPNPAELLGSKRFADFMSLARREFEYVLIDAPPIQLVSDAAILATQADGTLIVLDAQRTRKSGLRQAVRSLDTVGANILGTVMNNVDASAGYYPSDYTYS